MTHSYVYHPNLLASTSAADRSCSAEGLSPTTSETGSQGTLYNLTGRATLLRDKPYRGSLVLRAPESDPERRAGAGDHPGEHALRCRFLAAGAGDAGAAVSGRDALAFPGRGADRIIDDQIDRFDLRASRSYGALGSTQLQYQATQQVSMSGSPNLPIQTSNSSNQGLSLDSRFQFGATRQYDLTNLVTFNTQNYTLQGTLPERRDCAVFLDLRGRHSDRTAELRFLQLQHQQPGRPCLNVQFGGGGAELLAAARTHGGLGHARRRQPDQPVVATPAGSTARALSAGAAAGCGQVSYGLRYDQREQQATAAQTGIIGERITLTGTAYSPLAHQHVTAGSVAVSNTAAPRPSSRASDYTLTLVGAETRVQRLIGGDIVDGQDVLVDYLVKQQVEARRLQVETDLDLAKQRKILEIDLEEKGDQAEVRTALDALRIVKEQKAMRKEEADADLERQLKEGAVRHQQELERIDKLSALSTEALIALGPSDRAPILAELQRSENLKGYSADQILAMAAEKNNEVAKAFQEKYRNASAADVEKAYERMLGMKEKGDAEFHAFADKAMQRMQEMYNRGMDTQRDTSVAAARSGQPETTVITPGSGILQSSNPYGQPVREVRVMVCPECHQKVAEGNKFCDSCGHKF